MPRQMNLLNFLNQCTPNPSKNESTSTHNLSIEGEANRSTPPLDEAPSIILDTPEPLQNIEHRQNIPHLAESPVLTGKSSVKHQMQRDRRSIKRRSSTFIRERQSELQGKYSLMLMEEDLSHQGNDRRIRISAKMRRGNFDGLNYAPADQLVESSKTTGTIQKECTPAFPNAISERSKLMVAKAVSQNSTKAAGTRSGKPTTDCNLTENEDSFSIELCDTPSPKPSKYSKLQCSTSPSKPSQRKPLLSKYESDVLNDVLNLLPEPKAKPPAMNNHRSEPATIRPHLSFISQVTNPAIGPSNNEVTTPTVKTGIDEEIQNTSWDTAVFNLSDWSPSPPKVLSPLKCTPANSTSESDVITSLTHSDKLSLLHNPQRFYRAKVVNVKEHTEHCQLATVLLQPPLPGDLVNMEITIKLLDSWSTTCLLSPGDLVHLVPGTGAQLSDQQFTLSDPGSSGPAARALPGCLVLHPDLLVTGTSLVGSLRCQRRVLLQLFWSGGGDADDAGEQSENSDGQQSALARSPLAEVMLVGSLLHELFQVLAVADIPTKAIGENTIRSLLNRPENILQLYSCNTKRREMQSTLLKHVDKVLYWMSVHRGDLQNTGPIQPRRSTLPVIRKVHDVEENIWSSRFGIKGKIDLTLFVELPPTPVPKASSSRVSLVPLELKTGRPTYSVDHKGQVYLYLLLLLDRYGPTTVAKQVWPSSGRQPQQQHLSADTASAGWLAYLQEAVGSSGGEQQLIRPDNSCFAGLLQTRNQLAAGWAYLVRSSQLAPTADVGGGDGQPPIWLPDLTEPVKETHVCRTCPVQLVCGLLYNLSGRRRCGQTGVSSTDGVQALLSEKCSHLVIGEEAMGSSASPLQFFAHWSHLLCLEHFNSIRQEQIVADIVTMSNGWDAKDHHLPGTHKTNPCLRNLILLSSKRVDDGFMVFPKWQSALGVAETSNHSSSANFQPRDLVLVSSDHGEHMAVTLATVVSTNDEDGAAASASSAAGRQRLVISTDRPLPEWIKRFRVDRHASPKVMQLNMSNLVGLMQSSPLGDHLRQLIVHRRPATFAGSLSKSLVQSIRALLKPLNSCQRTAVLRVLMANDYVLIDGYPGTGKTQTLVVLLRVLIQLRLKTLVVAHTHSAVDNLLSRLLLQTGETDILRLGPKERVPENLFCCSLEHILGELCNSSRNDPKSPCEDPVDFIRERVEKALVVGCTALAASGGPSLRHTGLVWPRFDVVLVDEAGQLLLPTTLGALLCLGGGCSRSTATSTVARSPRFVLVGDRHQLPPLVQSRRAGRAGLEQSLFTYLLQRDPTDVKPVETSPAVVPLTLQYRMNAPILSVANQLTYRDQMRPANDTIAHSTLPAITSVRINQLPHWLRRVVSGDLSDAVLHLDTRESCTDRSSSHNSLEAVVIKRCLTSLLDAHSKDLSVADIGVMAPYRCQVAHIESLLVGTGSSDRLPTPPVEINTVDQFQGKDKRVVLLSLTICSDQTNRHAEEARKGPRLASTADTEPQDDDQGQSTVETKSSALLDNLARLTVAVTRAKQKLIVLGCSGGHQRSREEDEAGVPTGGSALARLFSLVHQLGGHVLLPRDPELT